MATTAYLRVSIYRHPGSAILLQKQVSKASIAKIVGGSLPPFTALSRQGGYAHTLKGYFYTNLGGTLYQLNLYVGQAFGRQVGQHLMAEQMRVQRLRKREELLQAMAHGSAAAWGHLNLLEEYDFSEDKLQDSVGIKPPKLTD